MTKEIGGSTSGVLGHLLTETRDALRPADFALLQQKVIRTTDMSFRIEQMNREFFTIVNEFARLQREGQPQSNYAWQLRVLPSTRTLPYWEEVEIAWDSLSATIQMLFRALEEIYAGVAELVAEGYDNLQDVMGDISNVARRLGDAEANVSGMISKPN